jgi:hypothetical protein
MVQQGHFTGQLTPHQSTVNNPIRNNCDARQHAEGAAAVSSGNSGTGGKGGAF